MGYKPGTVKEVILDIMSKHSGPMSSDDIAKEVLKQRSVKRNTYPNKSSN